ncbi:hypothetical protein L484_015929 [Morus notabilis]|uniref:Uncharacterized protein n=1 Tax=Morus notabilis TaxID=981085 RepID=W9QW24_9ROSA|nr:hypothetical protein L484_015929 [Morus notabilis]
MAERTSGQLVVLLAYWGSVGAKVSLCFGSFGPYRAMTPWVRHLPSLVLVSGVAWFSLLTRWRLDLFQCFLTHLLCGGFLVNLSMVVD